MAGKPIPRKTWGKIAGGTLDPVGRVGGGYASFLGNRTRCLADPPAFGWPLTPMSVSGHQTVVCEHDTLALDQVCADGG